MIKHVVENVTGPGGEHELLDGAVVLDPNHNLLVTRMAQERVAHGPKKGWVDITYQKVKLSRPNISSDLRWGLALVRIFSARHP